MFGQNVQIPLFLVLTMNLGGAAERIVVGVVWAEELDIDDRWREGDIRVDSGHVGLQPVDRL